MFNVGREFNKIASTQGAGFFGALPQASRGQELRMAGTALNNLTRIQAAKEGIEMAEREGAANRRSNLTNAIIGGIGDTASSALTAGIKNMQAPQVPDYSATSTPATMDKITSPDSWAQTSQAIGMPNSQGVYDSGFSWQSDPWQGQNPYSINIKGW